MVVLTVAPFTPEVDQQGKLYCVSCFTFTLNWILIQINSKCEHKVVQVDSYMLYWLKSHSHLRWTKMEQDHVSNQVSRFTWLQNWGHPEIELDPVWNELTMWTQRRPVPISILLLTNAVSSFYEILDKCIKCSKAAAIVVTYLHLYLLSEYIQAWILLLPR